MVVRHRQIEFASGALVFPGGSVDPEDRAIAADPLLCAPDGLDPAERAFRVGAARETFEECGVLLARERGSSEWVTAARIAAISPGRRFGEMLRAEGFELALDSLAPYAHWVTPPILPKRFDTHFYIAAAPAGQLAEHDGSESVDSVWIHPEQAIREAQEGRYSLIFVTELNLRLLAQSTDTASALASAKSRKIVTVEPVPTKTERGYSMRIPIEAGYGGEVFDMVKTA